MEVAKPGTDPLGWLEVVRRVRNQVEHRHSPPRLFARGAVESVGGGTAGGWSAPTQMKVAGPGDDDVQRDLRALMTEPGPSSPKPFSMTVSIVPWLSSALEKTELLCALMLRDRPSAAAAEIPTAEP